MFVQFPLEFPVFLLNIVSIGLSSSDRSSKISRYFQTQDIFLKLEIAFSLDRYAHHKLVQISSFFPNSGLFWKQDQDFSGYFLNQISRQLHLRADEDANKLAYLRSGYLKSLVILQHRFDEDRPRVGGKCSSPWEM